MPQAKGANAIIGYQVESTYAADPGTPDLTKLYFVTESLRLNRELLQSNIIQSSRNPTAPSLGKHAVAGQIATELQAYIGYLLKGILGAATYSVPTHTLKVGASVPSFTIEKGFTDITTPKYFKYSGCKVNKASLKVRPEGPQELTLDFIGAKETVGTSTFDATPTDLGLSKFLGFNIAAITEGGVAIAIVTEADIDIENNLDGNVYCINTAAPGVRRSLPEGKVRVSGKLTALFEDDTLYAKAIAGTESALVVTYTLGTGAGTAGNEQLVITVPELVYSPNAPVVSGPAGLLVELPFEAYYGNDAGASTMIMTLKNTQASMA
ncbi:MAG: phage tail tube protein [Thermodesulfobacteriota bacterium]